MRLVLMLLISAPLWADGPVPGRLLVNIKDVGAVRAAEVLKAPKINELEAIGVRIVNVTPGTEAAEMAKLSADPGIESVEQDYSVKLQLPPPSKTVSPSALHPVQPDDPYYPYQWAYPKIGAPDAWTITRGSRDVIVAIVDSGICLGHPDLAAKVVANVNFSDAPSADDFYGHGTHVAGIVGAVTDNGIGVSGTAWNTSLMNVKATDDNGVIRNSAVTRAIMWASLHGANVINMSFGLPATLSLHRAIQFAARKQVTLVAAAGNEASSVPTYPAGYAEVISVGATDENDQVFAFSSYGPWVDVAAPGVDILSTGPTHPNFFFLENYGYLSGTSMSTAFVSGEAALLLSLQPRIKGDFTDAQVSYVRNLIESTTDNLPQFTGYFAHGRINLYKAISANQTVGR